MYVIKILNINHNFGNIYTVFHHTKHSVTYLTGETAQSAKELCKTAKKYNYTIVNRKCSSSNNNQHI